MKKKLLIVVPAVILIVLLLCVCLRIGPLISIDTPASVFESGDEMYTIIWTTNNPGTGYVTYTYNGDEYTVNDQVGGNIRSLDTIHSVRVPKEHLDGNTYAYHSERVMKKGAYTALKGKTVHSEPVEFRGYGGEREINALVLSDIHGDPEPAEKAASFFEQIPSILVLNGDIVSHIVEKKEFVQILEYAYQFSGGEIPVVYSRGNHEPRGGYASDMLRYFRTSSGGLYYTFRYGPLWSVVLDSGEDKEDGHKEYSGLVDFRTYIADETKWLEEIDPDNSEYRLCIAHKPALNDLDGGTWLDLLAEKEIDAVISGHRHTLELHYEEGSQMFYRLITGGKNGDCGFIATMLTFDDGEMRALSYDVNGEVKADEVFTFARG